MRSQYEVRISGALARKGLDRSGRVSKVHPERILQAGRKRGGGAAKYPLFPVAEEQNIRAFTGADKEIGHLTSVDPNYWIAQTSHVSNRILKDKMVSVGAGICCSWCHRGMPRIYDDDAPRCMLCHRLQKSSIILIVYQALYRSRRCMPGAERSSRFDTHGSSLKPA